MQSSARVHAPDSLISTAAYTPRAWYAAAVPGTVLGSLVADSVYRNLFYGRNLEHVPDSLFRVGWWYLDTFRLKEPARGQVTRLRFDGVNYRADVWLNGKKIGSSDTIRGGFCRFTLNAGPWIRGGLNRLAVRITPPDTGDLTVGFVDWNPEPPDHNMGIWREVRLLTSGPVSIEEPFVATRVDTPSLDRAGITVSALLQNHADRKITGVLKGVVDGKSFSRQVVLPRGGSVPVVFRPDSFGALVLRHPRLWWVHTLGTPNLYDLHLSFTAGGAVCDTACVRFGVRSVSSYITPQGQRGFRLNGKKILIRGGGWTDPMLLNASPAYEEAGMDYAVHMNLNAIRMEGFWGHDQHLYDLCDEKGILVMAGLSCQWEWAHLIGQTRQDKYSAIFTAEQNRVAARSWRDQVTWLRNHPSIFLWLYGSDKWPRPSLEKQYLAVLRTYDTTRPHVASAAEHTSILTGPTRMKMRGPYDYVPPDYWYVDTSHGGAFGFNTETGPGPEVPVLSSLKRMIPADSLWPVSGAWLYHAARGNFHNLTRYNNAMDQRLGPPADLADYLRKAQYLNYEGMRAMYEAFEINRFRATGIIQWMYNASWPKLWWQLYDYYLMPTGAFYGARKAGEPLHIAYDYGAGTVDVLNNTLSEKKDLRAGIAVLDFNLKKVREETVPVSSLGPQQTLQLWKLPAGLPLTRTWFLVLRLYDSAGDPVSRNFYVLSTRKDELQESGSTWYVTPQSGYADLTLLQKLPAVTLTMKKSFEQKGDSTFVYLTLRNTDSALAFMVHPALLASASREPVTPVFWSAGYVTLLPGETRRLSAWCHTADLKGQAPAVSVGGWNIAGTTLLKP
jgi:exo-1,4-beta-D-glucosaminidase